MNKYGDLAMRHWEKYRPTEFASLTDPLTFFRDLGEQVATMVDRMCDQMEAAQPPELRSSEYLGRVGQLRANRMLAESEALADLVFLPSEEQTSDDPKAIPKASRMDSKPLGLGVLMDGATPMPDDPSHPVWVLWKELDTEPETPEQQAEWDSQMVLWKQMWSRWLDEVPARRGLL